MAGEDSTGSYTIPESTHIGQVALTVGSIDRVAPFYRELGFSIEQEGADVFLGTHDARLLQLHENEAAPTRGPDQAGLFHLALRVPDRVALADTLSRIEGAGLSLDGASDHLVSEALYLTDPEGNGVEVYRDRPREEWPKAQDGSVGLDTLPLDLEDLRRETAGSAGFSSGTNVGHVHLEVTDLGQAEQFYVGVLGMNVRARYSNRAIFLAAGEYHHHLGLNTWNGRSDPAARVRGLDWFELVVPTEKDLDVIQQRLDQRGYGPARNNGFELADPDGIRLHLARAPVEGC